MWSDTLLAAERNHLIRLAVWAATSAAVGMILLLTITLRRVVAPIVSQFAVQMLAWGSLELLLTAAAWRSVSMRDVSAATRLDRITWFNAGLDVGVVGVGLSVAILGWVMGRRLGVIGSGLGMVVQGLALLVLNLTFVAILARLI
jgi:hypothetical protein